MAETTSYACRPSIQIHSDLAYPRPMMHLTDISTIEKNVAYGWQMLYPFYPFTCFLQIYFTR